MQKAVSVWVPTYNYKDFIVRALESILMQEVSFSYEIIIHDDASTDGTTDIVREYEMRYPDIIKCMYRTENQLSKGNLSATWDALFQMCTGKYCAIVEGDDYWTDREKLQRQYDYMEAHPECSLYMHNAWRVDTESGEKALLNTFPQSGYYSQREQVLCGLGSKFPATASYFFVMDDLRTDFPSFIIESGLGDYPVRQILANKGQVYYDKRPMSVYRYMTSESFMKRLRDDLNAYILYVKRMCVFYEQLNKYLDYRFDDIYSEKINSDILGMAAATYGCKDRKIDVDNDWFADKLNDAYVMLSGGQWLDLLKAHVGEEAVWIYGTSTLAAICKQSLEQKKIGIKGFVVSDGYSKADTYEGYAVKYMSETAHQNDYYVAAVQPVNRGSIEQVLIANGEKRYCFPYAMKR